MSSNTTPAIMPAPDASKPASRMPSLNALAARINSNNAAHGITSTSSTNLSAPRPRLAASALRTSSNTSLSTAASITDSTAANAPSTRSTSPSALSQVSRPSSTTPPNENVAALGQSEPLTSEKLEKHNQEERLLVAEKKVKVGYKNIPSLDAITARLAKARALSIDGTAKPPEPEMIENPKTPGIPMKAPEHPLQFSWTIYHDTKSKFPYTPASALPSGALPEGSSPYSAVPPDTGSYEAGLTVIGEFDTVESFCRYFNWLKPPSKLEKNSNYHLFKSGIKPMWEDEANANGGKWVLTMKNNPALLDRCWSWLAMALVGEELEEGDEICGAVVSLRSKVDRIQVWTRSKDDVERLNSIGKKLVKLLDVSEADGIGLEFQYNTDDRPLPNKFLSIQAIPLTGFRNNFGPSAGGHARSLSGSGTQPGTHASGDGVPPVSIAPIGGAFGSFGLGLSGGVMAGSGVAAWRGGSKKGN